jgi:hypothetical protein
MVIDVCCLSKRAHLWNSSSVDNDEVMNRGDEALNASLLPFLEALNASSLHFYEFLLCA